MKRLLLLLSSIAMLFGLSSCKTKQYAATALPDKKIVFGKGGGFTGAVTEYILLENAQLFEHPFLQDSLVTMEAMKKKTCKQAFKTLDKIDKSKLGVQEPGNLYYFLHYHDGENHYETTWGAAKYTIDPEVKSIWDQLMAEINNPSKQ